ncbi:MAG TPA: GDP-mannose 4,6-dehydratase, partial [Gaiellaceae bacterium]|nr:GDP-mannose 4,6-dehydratase [Gaiellaceae bacterium]
MKPSPCALVIGAAGQDGSYLTELLLEQGYRVVGIIRSDPSLALSNLEHVRDRIELVTADLANTEAIVRAIATYEPNEIYNFASVSFGPDAWDDPVRTAELGALAIAR